MSYPEYAEAVLRKYKILDKDGNLAQSHIKNTKVKVNGKSVELGPGPLMAPDVIDRLISTDTTPDHRWLDWIFYQAGGGDDGKRMIDQAMKQIKKRYIDERVNGFTHPTTREFVPAVSAAEAEERWLKTEPKLRASMEVAGQDAVEKLHLFGYYRNWPGQANIYEKVVSAVSKFIKQMPLLAEYNEFAATEGQSPLPTEPGDYTQVDALISTNEKVERFHASKHARNDVRLARSTRRSDELIYQDDCVTVMAPLTWAAAVRYGWDDWAWANKKNFSSILSGESSDMENTWKRSTEGGKFYVYITFDVPVPAWVSRSGSAINTHTFANLALNLSKEDSSSNPDKWLVWDEENRNTLTIADVKKAILLEPNRVDSEDEKLLPISRGANVYKSDDEARRIAGSLDSATAAIKDWIREFDPSQVKVDALKLD